MVHWYTGDHADQQEKLRYDTHGGEATVAHRTTTCKTPFCSKKKNGHM